MKQARQSGNRFFLCEDVASGHVLGVRRAVRDDQLRSVGRMGDAYQYSDPGVGYLLLMTPPWTVTASSLYRRMRASVSWYLALPGRRAERPGRLIVPGHPNR
jgi:hypothetical protein